MYSFIIFLFLLYQLQTSIYGEVSKGPVLDWNAITEQDNNLNSVLPKELRDVLTDEHDTDDDFPLIKTGPDQAELQFRYPIVAVNIDYSKNAIALRFRKHSNADPEEEERIKSLENNFMRFGRDPTADFMRLGKRQAEQESIGNKLENSKLQKGGERYERSPESFDKSAKLGLRDSRGDNFMRFGRASKDFMRFGRDPADFMRLGRSPADFMRLGRNRGDDYFRLGRSPGEDFMRFGRSAGEDYMRFGRAPADFMRLGRSPGQDFMRFGRNRGDDYFRLGRSPGQDFMRFGRSPGQDFMRFGRSAGEDYMRFGRSAGEDYMRFGRSPGQDFMRFGRDSADYSRYGRNPGQDFMRFGRSGEKKSRNPDQNFMRFGRPDNFMRFGRSQSESTSDRSSNFMRFGRTKNDFPNAETKSNHTSLPLLQKNDIKAAAKLIHETDTNAEESNPMDKAIQMLFSKHENERTEANRIADDMTTPDESSQEQDY